MKQPEISNYEQQLLQDSGLYAAVAPVMYPFLSQMREETIAALINDYRAGKTEFLGHVARLATVSDLREELRIKEAQIKIAEQKLRS